MGYSAPRILTPQKWLFWGPKNTPTIQVQRVQGFVMAKPFIFGHPKNPKHRDTKTHQSTVGWLPSRTTNFGKFLPFKNRWPKIWFANVFDQKWWQFLVLTRMSQVPWSVHEEVIVSWFSSPFCENLQPAYKGVICNLGGGFKYAFFHPYLWKWSNLTYIFQRGWNHQPGNESIDPKLAAGHPSDIPVPLADVQPFSQPPTWRCNFIIPWVTVE